ncbi:MAG: hypothetical protein DMG21_04385, partial [Acidobacteria bacterium]
TVSLGGTGQAPVAALSPASLDFPGQSVHVTSAPETVTLTDSGGLPLTISNVSVTSPFAIQSSNCPSPSSSLPAGQGCTINLTFTAGFAGTTFGSLVVSDNSLGSATQTVSLTGEATVSFGAQLAGTTSVPQAVTIANGSTTKSVTVTSVTATGDFAVASNPCGVIVPGGNCAPMVTFKPTAGGTRKGALVITDNSPGSPHMVALSGTGEDFALSTNQVSATVAAGGTATFTLLVASQGGFNQTVNLSCALPATMAHATCAVTPSSVTPSSATAATPTVTITTTAPTMVAPQFRQRPDGLPGVPGLFGAEPWAHRHVPLQMLWLLALALLAAVAASCVSPLRSISARRSSPLQLSRIARALTLLMLLAWAACGGGPAPVHLAGTAPGNYTITLTATDPQASLTQTTTVNLTVSQ